MAPKQEVESHDFPSSSSAPVIAGSSKHPAESEPAEDGLKKEKKKTHGENGEKIDFKKQFERKWSAEEELVLLKECLSWHGRGADPAEDLGGFLDSIKDNLHDAATTKQLKNKLKRLKNKYQNNFKRGKRGLDPRFSKEHDSECYQFMKVIWKGQEVSNKRNATAAGNENEGAANGNPAADNENEGATNGKKKRRKKVQESGSSSYPFLTFAIQEEEKRNSADWSAIFWKECLRLIGGRTVEEMERKCREFHLEEAQLKMKRRDLEAQLNSEEAQLNLKRSDLDREMTTAVLNALGKKQSDG